MSSNGPIRKPPPRRQMRSICSCVAIRSPSRRSASSPNGRATRLAMKPISSAARTGVRPMRSATPRSAATTCSAVSSPGTTSTSFISAGGLKKCIPQTRSGPGTPAAIAVTESEEVLVARIASSPQTSARRAEQLALHLQVLRRGLDHQLAAREVVEPLAELQPRSPPRSASASLHRPRSAPLASAPRSRSSPTRSASALGVVEQGLEAAEAGDLGDPGAHRPGAGDADALDGGLSRRITGVGQRLALEVVDLVARRGRTRRPRRGRRARPAGGRGSRACRCRDSRSARGRSSR